MMKHPCFANMIKIKSTIWVSHYTFKNKFYYNEKFFILQIINTCQYGYRNPY